MKLNYVIYILHKYKSMQVKKYYVNNYFDNTYSFSFSVTYNIQVLIFIGTLSRYSGILMSLKS